MTAMLMLTIIFLCLAASAGQELDLSGPDSPSSGSEFSPDDSVSGAVDTDQDNANATPLVITTTPTPTTTTTTTTTTTEPADTATTTSSDSGRGVSTSSNQEAPASTPCPTTSTSSIPPVLPTMSQVGPTQRNYQSSFSHYPRPSINTIPWYQRQNQQQFQWPANIFNVPWWLLLD